MPSPVPTASSDRTPPDSPPAADAVGDGAVTLEIHPPSHGQTAKIEGANRG